MLAQIPGIKFHPEFVPVDQKTVLGRLQRESWQRMRRADAPFEPDDSLTIVACPGIRREAEIHCQRDLEIDPRGCPTRSGHRPDRLRFRDFAVLLADQMNQAGLPGSSSRGL